MNYYYDTRVLWRQIKGTFNKYDPVSKKLLACLITVYAMLDTLPLKQGFCDARRMLT